MAEAIRVVKPGGKIVVVDYHRPIPLHPLRPLVKAVFHKLEPYAMDLWNDEIDAFLPPHPRVASITKQTYCGGLYQKLVLIR
jgi:ubiquinone/menaquinone biosynthesis C-methylase UbiE